MKKVFILTILCILLNAVPVFAEYDRETIQKVQQTLNDAGFDCGTPDGIAGSKTAEAINRYQESKGLTVTGTIDDALLKEMEIEIPAEDATVTETEADTSESDASNADDLVSVVIYSDDDSEYRMSIPSTWTDTGESLSQEGDSEDEIEKGLRITTAPLTETTIEDELSGWENGGLMYVSEMINGIDTYIIKMTYYDSMIVYIYP